MKVKVDRTSLIKYGVYLVFLLDICFWFLFPMETSFTGVYKTIISREYSSEWRPGDEPYYPVNDEKNIALYAEYKKLADAEDKVIFGGRLGEYKYYDMDQVIASALSISEQELKDGV